MLRAFLSRIQELGVTKELPAHLVKQVRFCNSTALAAFLFATIFILIELPLIIEDQVSSSREAIIISMRMLGAISLLLPLRLSAKYHYGAARALLIILSVAVLIFQSMLYAHHAPAHLFFFPVIAAVLAMFSKSETGPARMLLGVCTLGFITSLILRHVDRPLVPVQSTKVLLVMDLATSLGALALAFVIAHSLRTATERAEKQVIEEQEKSDRLLLNILPGSIAKRLKEDPDVIADGFNEATVLFADLVGFTPLTEKMNPKEVITLMDKIFSCFDNLSEQFGLEKIKTIGDAYMLAGGLPEPTTDHADAVAKMALAMLDEISKFTTSTGLPLQVRIGMASGPLVAGVIGRKKFIYDLWGDTVNTASRMESHGVEGRIQVSESTWTRLRHEYDFTERGTIEIKGKGKMRTWFLDGTKKT